MVTDNPDFDDPSRANDVGGPADTLRPTEALDSDDVRNDDGDDVVDPPDHWYEADKDPGERESLDAKLGAEEPDADAESVQSPAKGAQDFAPPEVARDVRYHRGQVNGTPEDGDSLFPVVE